MKVYTNKSEFTKAVRSGVSSICLIETTEEPSDALAIQGLNSLSRKSKVFGATPIILCRITDEIGKSKYLYYYSLQYFFDDSLMGYNIYEFHCNKHQKVIATLGRLFHELFEQNFNVQGNEYDIHQLLHVYKSSSLSDDLNFVEFLESPHFLECIQVNDLIYY